MVVVLCLLCLHVCSSLCPGRVDLVLCHVNVLLWSLISCRSRVVSICGCGLGGGGGGGVIRYGGGVAWLAVDLVLRWLVCWFAG